LASCYNDAVQVDEFFDDSGYFYKRVMKLILASCDTTDSDEFVVDVVKRLDSVDEYRYL